MEFLKELENLIAERKINLPKDSYTTTLFKGGLDRILKKIGEEAGEVIIAAKNRNKEELANESADLIFHLLILLQEQNMRLEDVVDVLIKRNKQVKH